MNSEKRDLRTIFNKPLPFVRTVQSHQHPLKLADLSSTQRPVNKGFVFVTVNRQCADEAILLKYPQR